MNKKIQVITSIVLLLVLLSVHVSYAIQNGNNGNNFFSVNSSEIAQKETLKIIFDLSKIEYDNFKIALSSNINNDEIFTNNNVTLNEESNAVVINIDKNILNLNKIEMYYVVPENAKINSKIQLNAKVIAEIQKEEQDEEGNTITTKQEQVVLEGSQVATVKESKENENNNNNNDNINTKPDNTDKPQNEANTNNKLNDNKEIDNKSQNSNQKENTSKQNNAQFPSSSSSSKASVNMSKTISFSSSASSSMITGGTANVETATYNGSNNNYLKSLKVKGISLNTKFNKENTTYFIKVTDTAKLNITATAEDSSAKVVVTGNDSIKKGTNKILIAVTAENGDTRYYRIFVNCTEN